MMIIVHFRPLHAKQLNRTVNATDGVLSIVLSPKNGNRVSFAKSLVNEVGLENKAYLATDGETLIISATPVVANSSEYQLKDGSAGKKIVYCAELARELAVIFKMSFDDCVCRTISDVEYKVDENANVKYAIIGKQTEDMEE